MLTDRDLEELRQERHDDYLAEAARNTTPPFCETCHGTGRHRPPYAARIVPCTDCVAGVPA